MADISELEVGTKVRDDHGDVGIIVKIEDRIKVWVKYTKINSGMKYGFKVNEIYWCYPQELEIIEEQDSEESAEAMIRVKDFQNNKEGLPVNLEGYFKIEEKNNGYVVYIDAEEHESELICDDYKQGVIIK
jgi:hypothetical protein